MNYLGKLGLEWRWKWLGFIFIDSIDEISAVCRDQGVPLKQIYLD